VLPWELSDGSFIDGSTNGNATRHIDHSCCPNVYAIEYDDEQGALGIRIRANRSIDLGEELFLDYALNLEGEEPTSYPCSCGHRSCRGSMALTGRS
jgi:SET domain-containing protein